MRKLIGWLGVVSLAALGWGCQSTEPNLRPPKAPEEFVAPPNEQQYSRHIEYPKESMDGDPLLRKNKGVSTPGLTTRPGSAGQRPVGPGM